MGNQLELLEAKALKLTAGERAAFAQLLLASLDEDTEIEEAWAFETERRIADIESGAVQDSPQAAHSNRSNRGFKVESLAGGSSRRYLPPN